MRGFEWQRAVRDDPTITGTRMLVLLTVGVHLDGSGYLGIDQVAASTGLGERTVRRHLAWARHTGWLYRSRRGHRLGSGQPIASEYRLTIPSTGQSRPVEDDAQPVTAGQLRQSQPANRDAQPVTRDRPCPSLPEEVQDPRSNSDESEPAEPKTESPVSDVARELTRHFAKGVKSNGHKLPKEGTTAHRRWLADMDRLLRLDDADPSEVERVIDWCVSDFGDGNYPGEAVNVRSVPKFRERYSQLRLKAQAAGRNGSGGKPATQQVSRFDYSGAVQK